MKAITDRAEELAEAFSLPADLLLGAAKVTVTAGKRLMVDNHSGVLSYGEAQTIINLPRGKLTVCGDGLSLLAMSRSRLIIGGRIRTVEWE